MHQLISRSFGSLKTYCWLLATVALLAGCRPDSSYFEPASNREGNILAELQKNPDYSLFVEALLRSGYRVSLGGGGGLFTAFVPNNAAFQAFLTEQGYSSIEAIPITRLNRFVGNHLVPSSMLYPYDLQLKKYNAKKDDRYLSSGEKYLSVQYKSDQDFTVNGVKVTGQVTSTGNGVFYPIERFLVPQRSVDSLLQTNYSEFYKLVARFKFRVPDPRVRPIVRPDGRIDTVYMNMTRLAWNVADDANVFTFFAPTNAAVADFLKANNYTRVEDIADAAAKAIVEFHMVPPPNTNTYVAPRTRSALTPGLALTTPVGALTVGTDFQLADIATADIAASNGIVHAVNKVFVPAYLNSTYGKAYFDKDLSLWVQVFDRSEVRNALNARETAQQGYTILAPNNAALTAANITVTTLPTITKAVAEALVNNHIVAANARLADLSAGTAYKTLAGPDKAYQGNGRFTSVGGKTVTVTKSDVMGRFGYLHTVDGLLDR
jgi:transforming growth factor-beta-induced protein